ncbi:hypothetical protein KIPB_009670 [Kipferlia bialata]|uniref:Uncharacterized protein n=1 Tax=Kipferlia bialata TaxID=797122 RepID=A0A9K3GKY1_9EUKA|nr:hypothetical protein KIPB_009670 [Kipferlia bialata]|eukprot:g9670.t1
MDPCTPQAPQGDGVSSVEDQRSPPLSACLDIWSAGVQSPASERATERRARSHIAAAQRSPLSQAPDRQSTPRRRVRRPLSINQLLDLQAIYVP